jgi:hypothetical protein
VRRDHSQDAIFAVYFNNLWEESISKSTFCTNWPTTQEERRPKEMNKVKIEETVFTISNTPIEKVYEFKYLGRMLEKNDNDGPDVRQAIKQAQIVYGHLQPLLTKDRADVKQFHQ